MGMRIHDFIRLTLRKLGIPVGDMDAIPVVFTKDYIPKDSQESERIPAGTVAYLFQYFGGYGGHCMDSSLNPDFFIAGVVADEGELAHNAPGFVFKCTLNSATETVIVDDINILDLVVVIKEDSPIYIGAMDYWVTSKTIRVLGKELPYKLTMCSAIFIFIIGLMLFFTFPFVAVSTSKLTLVLLGVIAFISGCLFMSIGLRDRAMYKRAELNAERLPFLVRRLKESGRKFIADRGEVV